MSIFDVADHSQMFSDPSEGWKFHRVWLFSATSPFIFTADENASQTLMWVNLISKTHTDEPVSRSQTDHVAGITWTGDLLILFTFIFTVVCIIVSKNPVLFATIYYIYIHVGLDLVFWIYPNWQFSEEGWLKMAVQRAKGVASPQEMSKIRNTKYKIQKY